MSSDGVLVIGAGPFGLSIGAHLRSLGVDHRIVGRHMTTWKDRMPAGTKLRSEPYGSDMSAPRPGHDLAGYCKEHGLRHVERLGPLDIERFLDYSDWYSEQLVGPVTDSVVTDIAPAGGRFRVSFADTGSVVADQVVVATGVVPYKVLPQEVAGLPAGLVSHTIDSGDLSPFAGRRVAVIGGGQSALETAALLHEAGADTRIVMRRAGPNWLKPNPETITGLDRVRWPVNKLCEGWHCQFWNTPALFRMLPRDLRVDKARSVLGPAGAWWLKDRVDGVVEVLTRHWVHSAEAHGSGVRLRLTTPGAPPRNLDVDHVVCGTGFKIDISRLPFLSPDLLGRIRTLNAYPVLDRAGESSVPGLYFAGAPASVSLGPSTRFIAGTHTTVPQLVRSLTRAKSRRGALLPVATDTERRISA